jgi:hypothetical protein
MNVDPIVCAQQGVVKCSHEFVYVKDYIKFDYQSKRRLYSLVHVNIRVSYVTEHL